MEAVVSNRKSIFDTRFDTNKIFVTVRSKFSLRTYKNKVGESLLYLDISSGKDRIRLNTDVYVEKKMWDPIRQRIKGHPNAEALNLVLENIEAKLTTIRTAYMLQERRLTPSILVEQFQKNTPDFDFIAFYRHHMEMQSLKKQTIKNHRSVLKKLENFRKEIPFHKVDMELFQKYRRHYHYNSLVTYNTDLKCIKKYLKIAQKKGVKFNIDLDDLRVNVDQGKAVYLEPAEMRQLIKYYYSEFLNPSHILPLGYFLFSCYTGLRISDIQERSRAEILQEKFQFKSIKTDSLQYMKLNPEARAVVLHQPELFEKKLVDQKINFHLKAIAKLCKIDKNLTMHVGRHTFATTFIRNKGDIYRLKALLGHAKIEHTLRYVHLVNSEMLDDLDKISF